MARSKDNAQRTPRSRSKPARRASTPRARGRSRKVDGRMTKITIASDHSASRDVQKRIVDAVIRHGYNGQNLFGIKLALEEAMINAIKHGNKLDPKKRVHVEYSVTPRQVEIIIEDEGQGFDRSCVPDPTQPENIEKCSGRGLLLMEAYMNKIEFSKGGRRVRMIKKNEPDLLPRK
jgi:serine/threonine-protein kinase RsbW